jgi:hypothetical protein
MRWQNSSRTKPKPNTRKTKKMKTEITSKPAMINALAAFISQRSGIDRRNYGCITRRESREAFMGDYRPILKHGKQARNLLSFVSRRDISAEDLLSASQSAFSGRLSFVFRGDSAAVDYTTGQYFPTEYRAAACSVLARAVWEYFRTGCNYSPEQIRKAARREFGRAIASAWF